MKKLLSLILCITVILSAFTFVIPVSAAVAESDLITYIWDYDFSGTDGLENWKIGSSTSSGTGALYGESGFNESFGHIPSLTSEGTLKLTSSASGKSTYLIISDSTYNGKADKPKMVLTYRFKAEDIDDYFGSNWSSNTATTKYNGEGSVYASGGNVYERRNSSAEALEPLYTYQADEWVNVTVVYDNDAVDSVSMRDVYINGVYKGKFENPNTNNYNYGNKGRLFLHLFFYDASTVKQSSIEIDDVKLYELPESLEYKVGDVTSTSLALNFNMIPDSVGISNFTVKDADGENITVSDVAFDEADSRKVILTLANPLVSLANYTVTANGLTVGSGSTDVIDTALTLSTIEAVSFTAPVSVDESTDTMPTCKYNYAFNEEAELETVYDKVPGSSGVSRLYKDGSITDPTTYSVTAENTLKLTNNGDSYKYVGFPRTTYKQTDSKPLLVLTYRFKVDNTDDIIGYRTNYGSDTIFAKDGKIWPSNEEWKADTEKTNYIAEYSKDEWVNVTLIYDNNEKRRDVYINGVHKGFYADTNTTEAYSYAGTNTNSNVWFTLAYYSETGGSTAEIDDVCLYEIPSSLKYEVGTVTPDTVTLNFNMIPDSVLSSDFTVTDASGNPVAVSDATIDPVKGRSVVLKLGSTLTPEETYYVKATGLTVGSGADDVIDTALTLTTGTRAFSCETPALSVGNFTETEDGKVSVSITNNTDNTSYTLTLIYVGYVKNSDDTLTLKAMNSTNITVNAGEEIFTTNAAIDITGCDYTQAFLWSGLLPVTPSQIFNK